MAQEIVIPASKWRAFVAQSGATFVKRAPDGAEVFITARAAAGVPAKTYLRVSPVAPERVKIKVVGASCDC